MKRVPKLPSPAMIVALAALLVALAGTAVALPGKNTVDSGDIKNGQVRGSDVKESSLGPVPEVSGMRTARGAVGDGSEVTLLSLAGYRVVLTADSGNGCTLVLRNISAGANGNAEGEFGPSSNDFDEGTEISIASEGIGEGTEAVDDFYAHNATTSIQGAGAITREGDFGTGAACVGTVRAFTP